MITPFNLRDKLRVMVRRVYDDERGTWCDNDKLSCYICSDRADAEVRSIGIHVCLKCLSIEHPLPGCEYDENYVKNYPLALLQAQRRIASELVRAKLAATPVAIVLGRGPCYSCVCCFLQTITMYSNRQSFCMVCINAASECVRVIREHAWFIYTSELTPVFEINEFITRMYLEVAVPLSLHLPNLPDTHLRMFTM